MLMTCGRLLHQLAQRGIHVVVVNNALLDRSQRSHGSAEYTAWYPALGERWLSIPDVRLLLLPPTISESDETVSADATQSTEAHGSTASMFTVYLIKSNRGVS